MSRIAISFISAISRIEIGVRNRGMFRAEGIENTFGSGVQFIRCPRNTERDSAIGVPVKERSIGYKTISLVGS